MGHFLFNSNGIAKVDVIDLFDPETIQCLESNRQVNCGGVGIVVDWNSDFAVIVGLVGIELFFNGHLLFAFQSFSLVSDEDSKMFDSLS